MQKSTKNLRNERKTAGYTLDRLAQESGVPRSTIWAFEKGSRPLKAEYKEKIEKVLGVEICGNSTNKSTISRPYLVSAEAEALEQWETMPTDELKKMLHQCVEIEDWGATNLISRKLLARKLAAINQRIAKGKS